jgi:hypothetical protein
MVEEFLKYIPLDKSWIIRMGFLDLINGYDDINKFLEKQEDLGGDLQALKNVAEVWNTKKPLNVGESGTLYRFFRFYLWKNGIKRRIIKKGTLKNRKICNNPEIVNWPLEKLISPDLDNGTTQWVSAAIMNGCNQKLADPKYRDKKYVKIHLSYEAVKKRKNKRGWKPRYDETIENQARAFIKILKNNLTTLIENKEFIFEPKQPEDYCFARAFNLITKKDGKKMFPSLIGHETNRIKEMEKALDEANYQDTISSKDHRVIPAVLMKYDYLDIPLKIINKDAVKKSWPLYWEFREWYKKL